MELGHVERACIRFFDTSSDFAPSVAAMGAPYLWELPLCPCPLVPEPSDVGGVPSALCDAHGAEVLLQYYRHLIDKVDSMMEHSPLAVQNRIWQVGHRAEAISMWQLLAAPSHLGFEVIVRVM